MSFMAGGKGAAWTGRVLGGASLVTSGVGMYGAAASSSSGQMNWFEFGVSMASALQPLADHGYGALGAGGLKALSPAEPKAPGGRMKAAARGFLAGFTGNMAHDDASAFAAIESIEAHGRALGALDDSKRDAYYKAATMVERGLGKPITPEEGIYLASIIKDGALGKDAAIEALAKPKADDSYRAYLMRKAGEEIDLSHLPESERAFLDGIQHLDKEKAWNAIIDFESKRAERILVGGGIEPASGDPFQKRLGELSEAFTLLRKGGLTQAAKTRLDIGVVEMRVLSRMAGAGKDEALGLVMDSALPEESKPAAAKLMERMAESENDASKEHVDAAMIELAERYNNPARDIESELGYTPGSSGLESELLSRKGSSSSALGEGAASADAMKVARTLERMISQTDETGRIPGDLMAGFCAGYPEYSGALANLDGARKDELPRLIRQEAQAIVNARKAAELESAIRDAGLEGDAADFARAIHRSIHGEPVEMNVAFLESGVMERVRESVAGGMEEADAVVEAASGIMESRTVENEPDVIPARELEARRLAEAAGGLDAGKAGGEGDAEVISLDERRARKDDGPEPPDGPEAEAQALARTGTDGRTEAVGFEAGEKGGGEIVKGPDKWFGKEGGGDIQASSAGNGGGRETTGSTEGGFHSKEVQSAGSNGRTRDISGSAMESMIELPDSYRWVPKEFDGMRLDPERGRQDVRLLSIISDDEGSGGALYRASMIVDGAQKEVAVKVLKKPELTDKALESEHDRISELYGRCLAVRNEDPVAWKQSGGFSDVDANAMERLDRRMANGEGMEEAMNNEAAFTLLEGFVRYFDEEIGHARAFDKMGLGPTVFGRVDAGEGTVAFAMEVVRGKDMFELGAAGIESIAEKNGISVEAQIDSIVAQVQDTYSTVLKNNLETGGDLQFAILTEPQSVNGKRRKAGDIVYWDFGSFSRIEPSLGEADGPGAAGKGAGGTILNPDEIRRKAREQGELTLIALEQNQAEDFLKNSGTPDHPLSDSRLVWVILKTASRTNRDIILGETRLGEREMLRFIKNENSWEKRAEAILGTFREIDAINPEYSRGAFDSMRRMESESHIRLMPQGTYDELMAMHGSGSMPPAEAQAQEKTQARFASSHEGQFALARLARRMVQGETGAPEAFGALSEAGKRAVEAMRTDTMFILNAKGDDLAFERFLRNKRTGGRLLESLWEKPGEGTGQ